jgi:hypothetical protein
MPRQAEFENTFLWVSRAELRSTPTKSIKTEARSKRHEMPVELSWESLVPFAPSW